MRGGGPRVGGGMGVLQGGWVPIGGSSRVGQCHVAGKGPVSGWQLVYVVWRTYREAVGIDSCGGDTYNASYYWPPCRLASRQGHQWPWRQVAPQACHVHRRLLSQSGAIEVAACWGNPRTKEPIVCIYQFPRKWITGSREG